MILILWLIEMVRLTLHVVVGVLAAYGMSRLLGITDRDHRVILSLLCTIILQNFAIGSLILQRTPSGRYRD